jgi:hypothetical protein
MITRTRHKATIFNNPFLIEGVGRTLPPGTYDIITDEELIEGLSLPVYRRVATMMMVPASSRPASSAEMHTIDPAQLATAEARDALLTLVNMGEAPKPAQ